MKRVRSALGILLGLLVWAWVRTFRVTIVSPAGRAHAGCRVYAFFHGRQMALLGVKRRRRTCTLVSHSRDGDLQSGVMRVQGLVVLRGSSSKGAAGGVRQIVRALSRGSDAAFAVDGPRGPLRMPKPGAAFAALSARAVLMPLGSAVSSAIVLRRTWDRFEIPLPFARVAIAVGDPVSPERALARPDLLAAAMADAEIRATAALEAGRLSWRSGRRKPPSVSSGKVAIRGPASTQDW